MRIVHVCLAAFYIDGFGYQENILPRLHAQMGHDVTIIASTENYVGNTERAFVEARAYRNEDEIMVHRLAYSSAVPGVLQRKVRAYTGLFPLLEKLRPDLIFVHDGQFWDFLKIRDYARKHSVAVVADCHTDYVNSARGFVSRAVLHGILYRWIARRVDSVVRRYWATLPIRSTFLQDMYGLPAEKMHLLPFGVDDSGLTCETRAHLRAKVRSDLAIPDDALVFVTGGKLDIRKNIHRLIAVFSDLKRRGELGSAHLIVFGQADAAVASELAMLDIDPSIHLVGWIAAERVSEYLLAAEVAIFPGTHSVLWEQAAGLGKPLALHRWPGMEHLDLDGNTMYLDDAAPESLAAVLRSLVDDENGLLAALSRRAAEVGPAHFSYSAIARRALEF